MDQANQEKPCPTLTHHRPLIKPPHTVLIFHFNKGPRPKRAAQAVAPSPPRREATRPPRTLARGAVLGVVPAMHPSHVPPLHLQENQELSSQELQNESKPNEQVPLLPSLALSPPSPLLRNRSSLYKQKSWSPDIFREEAWLRRKGNVKNRQSKSVTDEDLDELKGCIELGFGFDSPEAMDGRLSDTLPALGFYYAVTKQNNGSMPRSAEMPLSTASDCDSASSLGSPHAICGPSDDPQVVKTRLRQWAQIVACSVRQSSS